MFGKPWTHWLVCIASQRVLRVVCILQVLHQEIFFSFAEWAMSSWISLTPFHICSSPLKYSLWQDFLIVVPGVPALNYWVGLQKQKPRVLSSSSNHWIKILRRPKNFHLNRFCRFLFCAYCSWIIPDIGMGWVVIMGHGLPVICATYHARHGAMIICDAAKGYLAQSMFLLKQVLTRK